MSQQYQRFKQTFLSEHPTHNNNNNNRMNMYSVSETLGRNRSYDNLHIQQQSHYPFEQIEDATFTQSIQQPYNKRLNENNNQNFKNNKGPYLGLNEQNYQQQQSQYTNSKYRQQLTGYRVNDQYQKKEAKYNKSVNTQNNSANTQNNSANSQNMSVTSQNMSGKYLMKSRNNNSINNNHYQQQYQLYNQDQLQRINSQLSKLRNINHNINHNNNNINNQFNKTRTLHQQQQFIPCNTKSDFKRQQQKYLHPNYFVNSNQNHNSTTQSIITTLRPKQFAQQQYQPNQQQYQPNQSQSIISQQQSIISQQQQNYPRQSLTPSKQLPIIYNTSPRTQQQHPLTSTSQHSIIPPTTINPNNSRLVIQSQPQQPIIITNNINKQQSRIIIPQQQIINNQYHQTPQSNNNTNSKISLSNYCPNPTPINIIPNSQPSTQFNPPSYSTALSTNQQFIPIKQYQRVRSQCITWQQQFQSQFSQINKLKQQNIILVERIKSFQNAQKQSYQIFKSAYQGLLKKYQQSLQKQCGLLVDRCRLQMRHNDRM